MSCSFVLTFWGAPLRTGSHLDFIYLIATLWVQLSSPPTMHMFNPHLESLAIRTLWETVSKILIRSIQITPNVFPSTTKLVISAHQAQLALCKSMLVLASRLLVPHVLGNGLQEDLPNNLPRNVRLMTCSYLDPPSCPSWEGVWCLSFSRHQKASLIMINFQMWQRVALQWHWMVFSSRSGCIPSGSMHLHTSHLLITSLASLPFTVGNTSLPQTVTGAWEAWEQPLSAKAEAKETSNTPASPITSARPSVFWSIHSENTSFEMQPHK